MNSNHGKQIRSVKTKINTLECKRNKAKLQINSGQSYVSVSIGKKIKSKQFNVVRECYKKQCYTELDVTHRFFCIFLGTR